MFNEFYNTRLINRLAFPLETGKVKVRALNTGPKVTNYNESSRAGYPQGAFNWLKQRNPKIGLCSMLGDLS